MRIANQQTIAAWEGMFNAVSQDWEGMYNAAVKECDRMFDEAAEEYAEEYLVKTKPAST